MYTNLNGSGLGATPNVRSILINKIKIMKTFVFCELGLWANNHMSVVNTVNTCIRTIKW